MILQTLAVLPGNIRSFAAIYRWSPLAKQSIIECPVRSDLAKFCCPGTYAFALTEDTFGLGLLLLKHTKYAVIRSLVLIEAQRYFDGLQESPLPDGLEQQRREALPAHPHRPLLYSHCW